MGRVYKKVINHDRGGQPVTCNWDDCTRDGFEQFKILQHLHPRHWRCDNPHAEHRSHIFCTYRHLDLWIQCTGWRANRLAEQYGGRIYGMLPTGSRGMTG